MATATATLVRTFRSDDYGLPRRLYRLTPPLINDEVIDLRAASPGWNEPQPRYDFALIYSVTVPWAGHRTVVVGSDDGGAALTEPLYWVSIPDGRTNAAGALCAAGYEIAETKMEVSP